MEEKNISKRRKISRVLLWIGRVFGIIPILLFSFIFLPGLISSYPERQINSDFYEFLPMVILIGVGAVGYLLSWFEKKGWDQPGAWIMLCVMILMGLEVPIVKWIIEGQLRAFDTAVIFLFIWGIPGILIFIGSRLAMKDS